MGVVMFYHLMRSPVAEAARALLDRALAGGFRVMLRGTDAARLDALDQQLWLGPEDGFLPHGRQGGAHDARQPVLLGQGPVANAAQVLMLVDGADVTVDEARGLERVLLLFDGQDDAATAAARMQWKTLTAAGLPAQYWSEDSDRWEKKRDSAGA